METRNAQACLSIDAGKKLEWLDTLFADEVLSPTAKNVAWRLVRHHNDKTGLCFPKQATLAAGIGRKIRVVNDAIRELKEAGWIRVKPHRDGAHYALVLDRAEGSEVREIPQASYAGSRVAGTRKSAQVVREIPRTEPPKGTTHRTTHSTTAPAAIEGEVMGPADEQPIMPDLPATTPPPPANDDKRDVGVEVFSGWAIPSATIREWEQGFSHLDIKAELARRVPWFVVNVPEERRLAALASKLGKVNEENRLAAVTRRENKQADVDGGVDRCPFTGRDRAKIRKASSRFHIPVTRRPERSEAA